MDFGKPIGKILSISICMPKLNKMFLIVEALSLFLLTVHGGTDQRLIIGHSLKVYLWSIDFSVGSAI